MKKWLNEKPLVEKLLFTIKPKYVCEYITHENITALVPNSSVPTKQLWGHSSEANIVIFVQRRTYPASLSHAVCKVYLSRVVLVNKQKVQNVHILPDYLMQTKAQSVKRIYPEKSTVNTLPAFNSRAYIFLSCAQAAEYHILPETDYAQHCPEACVLQNRAYPALSVSHSGLKWGVRWGVSQIWPKTQF